MAWFHMPKTASSPSTAQPCFVCGRADGTTPVATLIVRPAASEPPALWICPGCRDTRLPGPSHN